MRIPLLSAVAIVWLACAVWLPARARAQSGSEVSPVVPVHPDVSTIVQLPDEILDVRSADNHDIMVKGVGSELYLRPKPDTPAGVEVFIEVQTRTLHRIILVRVVERAEDAMRRLAMPAAPVAEFAEAAPGASSVTPALPGPPVPVPPEPSAPASSPEPEPVLAEPEPVARAAAADTEGASVDTSRFALSVHAVAALGTTELAVPGYESIAVREPHRLIGMRLAVAPPDTWWAVEANIGWEWLAAPTVHDSDDSEDNTWVVVSGPSLRVDAGMRARFPARWSPTAYMGLGLQAHHRDIENIDEDEVDDESDALPRQSLPFGGVLALGLGLEYRTGDLSLGLEVHIRQGVPDDYHSVSALLSVGFFLDQGE